MNIDLGNKAPTKSALSSLFLTVFIDLVGFGIIIPLVPYLARTYSATPTQIGWLMSIYSITQFLFSPVWGRLSDRFGRKTILQVSLVGGGLSYIFFAFASSYEAMMISRAMAGLFAATISTAHAYIADLSEKKDRSRYMGIIGAAFGVGFILGPVLGAGLGWIGERLGDHPPFGSQFAALGAALLCFINFLWSIKSLPRVSIKSREPHGDSKLKKLFSSLLDPNIQVLIWIFFLTNFAMALMEVMLFPLVQNYFSWTFMQSSMGFAYVGLMMAFTQGYLIRKPLKNTDDRRLMSVGCLIFSLSLFAIPFSHWVVVMALTMTLLAIGNGLIRPSNLGLISVMSPESEQGQNMGVTQSVSALGRIVGPVTGGYLFENYGSAAPFWLSGLLALVAGILSLLYFKKWPNYKSKI